MVGHHPDTDLGIITSDANSNTGDSDSNSDVGAVKYGSTADRITCGDTSTNGVANHCSYASTNGVTDDFPNTTNDYPNCRPAGDKNDTNSGDVGDLFTECDKWEK